MPDREDKGLLLSGLDGSNPLGFLAAIGTLCACVQADSSNSWRLRWTVQEGAWAPVLVGSEAYSEHDLARRLADSLHSNSTPEFDFAQDLNITPSMFRELVRQAQCQAKAQNRRFADFMAAYGCESLKTEDKKGIQDTALRTMSGQGHQHFLGTMKKLTEETRAEHLHQALFGRWKYPDEKLGMRWDPQEDRRYALRWGKPSGSPTKTMRGANRLAIEALSLLPSVPSQGRLRTTGFFMEEKNSPFFTWPIWEDALRADVVRSLLALSELQRPTPNRDHLRGTGIVEVYRSQRISVDRYRNFLPASPA